MADSTTPFSSQQELRNYVIESLTKTKIKFNLKSVSLLKVK